MIYSMDWRYQNFHQTTQYSFLQHKLLLIKPYFFYLILKRLKIKKKLCMEKLINEKGHDK